MKRNARRLLALVIGLALLVSLFAVAEDGGQEAVDLGVDIVIDAETGTADGIVTDGGIIVENEAGELEIEPEGVATPGDGGDLDLDLGLNGTGLESNAEALAPTIDKAASDEEQWEDWYNNRFLPDKPGNYSLPYGAYLDSTWEAPQGTTKLKMCKEELHGPELQTYEIMRVPKGATVEIIGDPYCAIRNDTVGIRVEGGTFRATNCRFKCEDVSVVVSNGGTFIMDIGKVTGGKNQIRASR